MDIDIAGPIIDAIVKKQSVILKLDEQILENTSDEDIEVEITDADEYNLDLETHLRRYKKLAQTVTRTCTELSHESIPNTRPVMNMHEVNSETRPSAIALTFDGHVKICLSRSAKGRLMLKQSQTRYVKERLSAKGRLMLKQSQTRYVKERLSAKGRLMLKQSQTSRSAKGRLMLKQSQTRYVKERLSAKGRLMLKQSQTRS
ncbi:unnamed protein product [Mytilus edulis]|uniref:Uncharacterized protein n=1 Tax=Mytilus edulis TaxID=6550 RepID=A0A8S3TEI3_MYTED|nr:unnamed protein product [Mytilus edulis]